MGGASAGNLTIRGMNRTVTGAITASGGSGAGATAQTGGNAGNVVITGSDGTSGTAGTLSTAAITASTGAAILTGAGGAAGSITAYGTTVTTGALATTGGTNGAGGAVTATATGVLTVGGAITSSGGPGNAAGAPGGNAGIIALTGNGIIANTLISANGGAGGGATLNQAGGNAANVTLTSSGGISATAGIGATGGAASTTNAAGGNAGSITVQNSSAGNVTVGALSVRAGASTGTATSAAGFINMINTAASAFLQTGAIDTRGNNNSAGGNVTLSSQGALQFGGAATIQTTAGASLAGVAGQAGGNVSLSGDSVTTTGLITTSGGAGNGTDLAGGNAGSITVTALSGAIDVSAGTLTAVGGAASAVGNANGGSGGAVLLDAGAGSTITISNITTTGGNRIGTGIAGAGGNITLVDAVLLPANRIITATGGSAGLGTGGDIQFQSMVDSSGGNQTLTVNTGGTTTFGGVVGGTLALASLATNATGTTAINTTGITTTGAQIYGDAVTLGIGATLASTGGGAITFSNTVDGAQALTVDTAGVTTFTGAVGGGTALASLATIAGGTTAINGGSVITSGAQSHGDNVTLGASTTFASTGSGDISFAGTLNSAGAGRTLAVNTAGTTTFGGVVGGVLALTSLTTDAAGSTAINSAAIITTGAQSYNDALATGGAATLTASAGALTANGAVDATAGTLTLAADVTKDISFANAGNDFSTVVISSGNNVSLVDANALTLGASTVSGTLLAIAGGNLSLSGNLSAAATGDALTLVAGANFLNPGSATLSTPGAGGRWLIYSTNPASDAHGGLVYNFKHYGLTYTGSYGGPGTGNGFIYSGITPAITPSLVGTTSKVYDGATAATLVAGNYATSGAIDGDTVTLDNPATGTYDNRNVGASKNVSTTVAIASANNGAASVYGYTLSSTTASGNIGTITARPVVVTAVADLKTYDGTTSSAGAPVVTGTLYDAVGTAATQSYDTKNVGITKTLTASGLVVNDGNSGNNYAISYVPNATGVIAAAALTVTADDKNRPQGTLNPPFTATYGGFQAGETPAVLAGTLAFNTPATIAAPPGAYTITPFGQTSGNYAITYVNGTLTVGALPSISAEIESDLLRPQFAALQWLGVGNLRSELPDCVDRVSISDVAAMWGVANPAATQRACGGSNLTDNTRPRN